MDCIQREALQELHLKLMDDLDPWEIMIDFLFQRKCLNSANVDRLESIRDKRTCRRYFLELVPKKCSFSTFIEGLMYKEYHTHLAELIKTKVLDIHSRTKSGDTNEDESLLLDGRVARGRKRRQLDKVTNRKRLRDEPQDHNIENTEAVKTVFLEQAPEGELEGRGIEQAGLERVSDKCLLCPMCKKPNRINIVDNEKKRIVRIQHHLKVLSHDGAVGKFDRFIKAMSKRHKKNPDIKFALLDAIVGRKKVSNRIVPDEDVFLKMEKTIPYTTNPLAASMLYLSRKGSAIATRKPIEDGLKELNVAKSHSEFIQPCKDTGMVLYIEVNLLMQLFEKTPTPDLKMKIIRRLDEAINVHFAEEVPEVREDYTRMLYLKMVFCYLGIRVDAGTITDYTPSVEDIQNAESCLTLIDRLPALLDKRRLMFYHVAKSVLFKYRGVLDLALDHVNAAVVKANEGQFEKEHSCIKHLADNVREFIRDSGVKQDERGEALLRELEEDVQEEEVREMSSDEDDIMLPS
ncbi:uncharacterized protein LOC124272273 [Haliotis rubra]|uniref:uncharacterized protein LOC124272273 n=1 Tax=Haliotis rubra TaxID=36100 RepID=UPI001EE597F0|nr:uncharacterized protein LOC124272273 [Haliotis rubra]